MKIMTKKQGIMSLLKPKQVLAASKRYCTQDRISQ